MLSAACIATVILISNGLSVYADPGNIIAPKGFNNGSPMYFSKVISETTLISTTNKYVEGNTSRISN